MFSEKRSAFENEVASFGKCVPPKFNPTRYGEPGNAEKRVAAHIKIIYREVMTDQKRDGWHFALVIFKI